MVRVDRFIIPTDLAVLNCDIDVKVTIILGRLFLTTNRVLVDVEKGDLKFRVNDEEVSFNICDKIKRHCNFQVNIVIELIDQAV